MAFGVIGTKQGMSRVFMKSGRAVPVTVIRVEPQQVVGVREAASDDKNATAAVTVVWGKPHRRQRNSESGQHAAAGVSGRGFREFRMSPQLQSEMPELGTSPGVEQFSTGDRVDATGVSRGKGFAGTVKRWNFSMQDATHGNSLSHRAPGSIGQCQFPGKVWKGKKMAGQMGNHRVTVQNLEIVAVDAERNLLLVTGAVPGAPGALVTLRPSIKSSGQSVLLNDEPAAGISAADDAAPKAKADDTVPAATEEKDA